MSESEIPEVIFTFKNTHDAIASEKVLIQSGIQVRVMPLPAQIGAGCGICLRVWPEVRNQAAGVLADAGILSQGIWLKRVCGEKSRYLLQED